MSENKPPELGCTGVVRWVAAVRADNVTQEWRLITGDLLGRKKQRCVATVSRRPDCKAVWHTWGPTGIGGENWSEEASTSDDACHKAMAEASLAAISQGFI